MELTNVAPTVQQLMRASLATPVIAAENIGRPRDAVTAFPCSHSQLRFWFEEQLTPQNPALNMTARWQLTGALKNADLEAAWQRLIARHDALRTALHSIGDEPVQIVAPEVSFTIPIFDLRRMPGNRQAEEAERLTGIEARTPFAIDSAPLIRVTRIVLSDTSSTLLVTAHQVVCDRRSLDVLRLEMTAIVAALQTATEPAWSELPVQFGTFAATQREQTRFEQHRSELGIARALLAGHKQFELLTDRPRPRHVSSNGDVASISLGHVPLEILTAALFTLFYRYTDEADILLGLQVTGRDDDEQQNGVGAYTNTVALRVDLSGNPDFHTLQDRVRAMVERAFSTRHVPLAQLIEIGETVRDASRNALFSISVAFEAPRPDDVARETPAVLDLPSRPAGVLYDIAIRLIDEPSGQRVVCEYNTDLFTATTISGLLESLRTIVDSVCEDSTQRIGEISLVRDALRHELVVTANGTQAAYPKDATLPSLIAEQALRTPHATAVRCGGTTLTYAQLEVAATQLARRIALAGCTPGRHVGILLERSCEMVVAMLAVVKAGCAYVPLDPKYPADRIAFIVADSALAATITHSSIAHADVEPGVARILVDEEGAGALEPATTALASVTPSDIAYVIYTSGSTGKPKGVRISHGALVNLLCAMRERPGLDASDTLVAVTTISFDIAGLELFLPLISGAQVVIAGETEVVDGQALLQLLRSARATVLQATPVTWQLLIDAGWRGDPQLRMLCGGEALSRSLANQLLERGADLWNMYGPTETTIWSSVARVTAEAGPVLIGPPIANTQFYVIDRNGSLVPPGVAGELLIGGDGLAAGYFGRDDLTRERFIPNAFVDTPDARMYRTGDIVRSRPGGYEYLGRTDHQIKLRGFRIELDEIVAALVRQPGVAEAAVITVAQADGDASIRAFVVAGEAAGFAAAGWSTSLRAQIADFLPAYMLPAAITVLDALPRTPNGKTDRTALAGVVIDEPAVADETPATNTEKSVGALVAELLSRDTVRRHSDLFALGFHSLLAVRLVARIAEAFDLKLTVREVFDHPSVAGIAGVIDATLHRAGPAADKAPQPIVTYNDAGTEPPLMFFHSDANAEGMYCRRLAHGVGPGQPIFAAAPHGSAGLPILTTIEAMALDYLPRLKVVQPAGPYRLGGYCDGGLVAFELARLLRARGDFVEYVLIGNAYAPSRSARPILDLLVRRFGLDESRDSRLREKVCANIARLDRSFARGPLAALRFLFERIVTAPQHRNRDRQNTLAHPDIPSRPSGTHETKRYFAQLVACFTYHPRRYDGDVVLFWSSGEEVVMGDPTRGDATKGWATFANDVRVVPMEGSHQAPFQDRAEDFGRLIARAIGSRIRSI